MPDDQAVQERPVGPVPSASRPPVSRDERPASEDATAGELIRAAADGQKLNPEQQQDALDWFVSTEGVGDLTHTFEINVGSVERKVWVKWTVAPVDLDQLRRIRKSSSGNSRAQRRAGGGDFDEVNANLQIVVEGTISPDLKAAAKQLNLSDPKDAVRRRFAHKPGLLTQIAGEVMSVSGYDDEDIREVEAGKDS